MAKVKVRSFSEQLRDAMASSGHTGAELAELAELAGVDPAVISRFMAGKREIRTTTVDRIAEALGLRLVEGARPKPRGRRPAKAD
jgi:transcriptional regulator with XRE-family HTH domain